MMTYKMEEKLSVKYWSEKYKNGVLGWDIGYVSTPIKAYIDQLKNIDIEVLIPGAGNSYEAEYIYNQKFSKLHVLDFSEIPLSNLRNRVSTFPEKNLHQTDFFQFKGKFDLIIEQTFLSAIDPKKRLEYVKKMHSLLKTKGKLVGVVFDKQFNNDHPPYGGDIKEYTSLFSPFFEIQTMERANNSIPERQGNEIFMILVKKD